MSKARFELNRAAFRKEVMQSNEMLKLTERYAEKLAGSKTHLKSFIGFDRAKTIIYPNTKENPG